MKKLMMTLAAGLSATALIAVTSDNIVGYQTVGTTAGKLNMPALQWFVPGGANIAIQDLFTDTSALKQGDGTGNADTIRVWNPLTSGYAEYFLYNDASGYYPAWDGKWIKSGQGQPTADTLAPGTAFWLLRQPGSDADLTTAGEVPSAASYTFNITKGKLNMVANPYPTAMAINGTNFQIDAAKAVQGDGTSNADTIRVWNPLTSGYAEYFLYNDASGYYPAWDGKWIKSGQGQPTTDSLPAGFGAWYLSQPATATDWTLTITKPF